MAKNQFLEVSSNFQILHLNYLIQMKSTKNHIETCEWATQHPIVGRNKQQAPAH